MKIKRRQAGSSIWLDLDDPPTKNALDDELLEHLRESLSDVRTTLGVKSLVISGTSGAFSSGGSFAVIQSLMVDAQAPEGPERLARRIRHNASTVEMVLGLPCQTIAVVDGPCIGAALGLAAACDLVLATPRASFTGGYARWGLTSDMGSGPLLSRVVGEHLACEILQTSKRLGPAEAVQAGLVDSIVSDQDVAEMRSTGLITKPSHIATRPKFMPGELSRALDDEAREFADSMSRLVRTSNSERLLERTQSPHRLSQNNQIRPSDEDDDTT